MIILYGGSFNPPTKAHYELSKYLIEKYKPQEFIFIPVGDKYNWKNNLAPFSHRFAMVRLLAEALPGTKVSDYEAQDEYQGTISTLNHFQKIYPYEDIYYVIGADNLLMITSWIRYEELLRDYHFLVLRRENIDVRKEIGENPLLRPFQHAFIIENEAPLIDVSATRYRALKDDSVVLATVNQYIYEHRLYGRGEENEE